MLTGGSVRAEDICAELAARGLGGVTVYAGERLSYPDEKITVGRAEELSKMSFGGLTALLIINPRPISRAYEAPYLRDGEFARSGAPMTKEETRMLCISKLRLKAGHILWEVGAGTGSVSVECALALSKGRVFAVEKDCEAMAALRLNKEKFGVCNMELVHGEAPEALGRLPAPDRVFIGGASGRIAGVVRAALGKNPGAGFVIAAVTLETLTEALRCVSELGLKEPEVVQLSSARAKRLGGHSLMAANNPVWLISFEGGAEDA